MLTVTPIPAFNDNYLWLIENDEECWVVDPGDAKPVKEVLMSRKRELTGILVTHHHSDHVGGIKELITPDMPVIGPAIKRYPLVNDPVSEGDVRSICGMAFRVIDVPGHTLNHVAYYVEDESTKTAPQKPLLFCGDTLFAGGCGRLFEGTPAQMNESLSKLTQLPSETLVYCAHEYTLANLRFALSVEPNNQTLIQHQQDMQSLRSQGIPTVPTTIKTELAINPFLRTSSAEIIDTAQAFDSKTILDSTQVFGVIRRMKDQF